MTFRQGDLPTPLFFLRWSNSSGVKSIHYHFTKQQGIQTCKHVNRMLGQIHHLWPVCRWRPALFTVILMTFESDSGPRSSISALLDERGDRGGGLGGRPLLTSWNPEEKLQLITETQSHFAGGLKNFPSRGKYVFFFNYWINKILVYEPQWDLFFRTMRLFHSYPETSPFTTQCVAMIDE